MPNYNKVLLMGHLTRDPQLSYTPTQMAIVEFGIATNHKWTGKDGSQKEEVYFGDCKAFGKTADNINKYFKKGRAIFVEGRLVTDSWTAQDGSQKSRTRINIDSFQFVGDKGDASPAEQKPATPNEDCPF